MYSISFLFLKCKNFHFSDGKVLTSCEKCGVILTGWTLVCVIQVNIAVAGIWCIGNTKISTTSKCWSIATIAIDSIAFLPSHQRQLCWWQTTWVDKTEQEWAWCFSVDPRTLTKQTYLVSNQWNPKMPFILVSNISFYFVGGVRLVEVTLEGGELHVKRLEMSSS